MRQKPPILNCNNNINCIISPTVKVNAAAIAATKMLPLSPPVPLLLHILLKPVRFSALYSLRQWLEPLNDRPTIPTWQTHIVHWLGQSPFRI
jgi:hypothetical protein